MLDAVVCVVRVVGLSLFPMSSRIRTPDGIETTGPISEPFGQILTPEALAFVAKLHRNFNGKRKELLEHREERQAQIDRGQYPDFLPETAAIRQADWKIAPIPADLLDRRVEITGPTDRKMVINALNSGANVYMADFEDANAPTWDNNLEGQLNLKDRWAGSLAFTDSESGKAYALDRRPAVLIVRPRGWHLIEQHVSVDGAPLSGALFDFALYAFHNAAAAIAQGSGPY